MNRIFRIVWNRAISQLVVTSELGRRTSGGSVAKRTPRDARTTVLPLAALAVALSFATPAFAAGNLGMPTGALLDINNGSAPNSASNVANQFQNYSVTFTASDTGNNYILFAFRQDPAYWTFGNVGLYAAGDTTTNLFTNPLFTQGGSIGSSGVQAPANWGVVYQTGTVPEAAGTWNAPGDGDRTTTNVNDANAGSWYDGAVGSFDGIYQGVDLVAGITYTISFTALSNNAANVAGSGGGGVEMGVFAGKCVSLTGPVANCAPDNPDFQVLATPNDAANAGGPSVVTVDPANPETTSGAGSTDIAFDGGTLTVDQTNPTLGQDVTITHNGGTIDQDGHDATFTGTISDETGGVPGDLNIVNSGNGGTVTLTGTNTYTGETTIDNGATLALSGNGSIAQSSGVTNNGTLDIGQANGNEDIASLGGNGTVVLGGNDLTITNGHDTYTGTIGGTGGVNVTGGTQGFTGTNTYTGGTTVSGGATVSIDNGAALGTGTISLNNGTLDTTQTTTLGNIIDVTGAGTVDTATGTTLTHSGAVTGSGDFVKDGEGTLAQSGSLTQSGATIVNDGTLVLSGTNTYGGGTVVNGGGTLEVSSDANLGGASSNLALNGGTLHSTGDVDSARNVSLNGSGTIDTDADTAMTTSGTVSGNGALVKNGEGTLEIDGVASHTGGTVVNDGTLVLTGNNTYTGGTTVNGGGTLEVSSDANLGGASSNLALNGGTLHSTGDVDSARNIVVTTQGTIDTDADTSMTTSGTVSGNGSLVKNGEGTLEIDGVASHTGGTVVNDGTLVLTGNNTYTGGTTVNGGGTLEVSSDANLGGASSNLALNGGTLHSTGDVDSARNVSLNGSGTIDTDADTAMTTSGTVSGNGALVKNGEGTLEIDGVASHTGGTVVNDGTLVLTGNNTYTGGTTVNGGGTLQMSSDANLGDASNGVGLNGGTLHSTGDVDSARNIVVTTQGTIDTDADTSMTTSGTVSGNGTLVKNGEGTLEIDGVASHTGGTVVNDGTLVLTGNNTYTGGTTVNGGGTLQVSSDANLGGASSNLALNGGTLHSTGDVDSARNIVVTTQGTIDTDADTSMTTSGTVSGNGSLVKNGEGTLEIDGVASHTGGTVVNDGTLVLTGNNTYTGGTTVKGGGTLQVSSDANLGGASSNLALNGGTLHSTGDVDSARNIVVTTQGTIDTDADTSMTTSGTVSGNGSLVKNGEGTLEIDGVASHTGGTVVNDGTLVLTGNNTYTGGTTVNGGGTLQMSSDANLGDASNGVGLNGGTLHSTGDVDSARNIVVTTQGTIDTDADTSMTTSGTVSGNGTLVKNGEGTLEIDGVASHTGGTVVNDGTLVLTGNNTYTGGTTVNGGGTLQVSSDANLGGASSNLALNGGTLHTTDTINSDRNVVLTGEGHFDVDADTTMATGGTASGTGTLVKDGEGRLVIGGVASHTGGTVVNDGILVLTNHNTYTGGNTINGGTLQVQNDSNLGAASNGIAFNGGSLHTTGSFTTARNLSLNTSGTIDTDVHSTLVATGPVSGAAGLVKNGLGTLDIEGVASHTGGTTVNAGTLILGGNNTYTGGNTIHGGTLQVSSDANLGAASNGIAFNGGSLHTTGSFTTARDLSLNTSGAIATDAGTTLTATGSISGANGLVKNGEGTLDISGVASHTGGTTVNDGTLILRGNNTYTGGTTINGGTLQVSSDANLGDASGNIAINGGNLTVTSTMSTDRDILIGSHGAQITTLDGVTLNQRGDISGSGGLVKLGGGTMIVYGNNTFTGGTLIQGGVIRINTGSSLGTGQILLQGGTLQSDESLGTGQEVLISGNSGVNVAAGTTTVLSGNLVAGEGNGCFVKSGKGYLSLTGQSNLASGTCVQDGVLSANGLLASSFVQVDSGAMLRGTGVISGPVNVEGRLAAGNSPGTLTVAGTVTMQAGSSLQVDIDGLGTGNGAGNYSRVLVVGEGNRFIADGTLVPTLRGITGNASNTYTPALGSTYRIVTADGGVEGRFDGIQQPTDGLPANARFLAFYGANDGHSIDLRVAPVSYATLLGAGAKRNGLAVAGSLDGAMQAMDAGSATAAQNGLLYAVSAASADRAASLVSSLSGEVHADQAAAARSAGLGMQRDVSDHLATDRSADMAHNVWANVTRDGNRSIADNQGSGFETGTDRTTGGIDLYAEGGTVFGVAATHHDTNVISHGGSGSIRGTSGMVYAQQALGSSFVLDGVAAYGNTDWTTRRPDPVGGSQLETRTSGKDTMASATLRMPMQTAEGSRIEPYVSVVWQKVERDAANERGSVAALSLDELSEKGTRVLAGVSMGSKAADPLASTLTWHAGVAVGADTGDLLDPTVHNTLAGQRFDTAAPGVGRGFVQVNANGTMRLGKSTYLYGGLTAEEGKRRSAYGVTAGVRVAF